ncbi:hypothetical protein ACFQHW_04585 [Lapidilactobacillus achengensis]|uniref:Uncharacterized protein n=1 Tax=Lapidilactobacillus achengensis TaxID=2486000 RepID=A0ABW1UPS8_9LACO|nr:hypothetical protein [Lapidilactobacillus achengensis]
MKKSFTSCLIAAMLMGTAAVSTTSLISAAEDTSTSTAIFTQNWGWQ